MKWIIRYTLVLFIATGIFTSCKKPVPKITKLIPRQATVVVGIDTKSIAGKIDENEAAFENLLRNMSIDGDTTVAKGKQEWSDLKNAGIELSENIYLSVVSKGGNSVAGGGNMAVSVYAHLDDGEKLQAYIKKKSPQAQIKKEGDINYAELGSNRVVAWNDDVVIATEYENQMSSLQFDENGEPVAPPASANPEAGAKAEVLSYFKIDEDQSVVGITEFRDLMQEKADGSFWVNSSSTSNDLPLPLPKLKQLLENSFVASTINFEDGKVVVNSKSYSAQPMQDIFSKYEGDAVNLDLVKRYPSDQINGFFLLSFDPNIIDGLVRYLEVGGMADGYLTRMMGTNFTVQDVVKAIKGDMAVIISDFSYAAPDSTSTSSILSSLPTMKLLLNIPVGDPAQMNRLMDKLTEMQLMRKAGTEYTLADFGQSMGVAGLVDNKNLLVANDSSLLMAYRGGKGTAAINADVEKEFSGKSAALFINIQSLLNSVQTTQPSPVLSKSKALFKEATGYAEKFNGKYTEGHFELRMNDTKQNSLAGLVDFMAVASAESRKTKSEEQMFEEDAMDDTTVAIP